MATFLIAFRRASPTSLVDRLIARFDGRGIYCHAEILWPDREKSFSCHAWAGCQYRDDPVYPAGWDFIPVELDAKAVSAACDMTAGDPYDYLGCAKFVLRSMCWICPPLIRWLSGPSWGKWYCAEHCARTISVSGGPDIRHPWIVGPNELYTALTDGGSA